MCKHILFTEYKPSDLDIIKEFAYRSDFERDGYGYIIRNALNEIETYKSIDTAEFYIELTTRLNQGNVKSLVIHHRTSTNKDGLSYAHPFEFNGNVMTHNGVVSVPGLHDTQTTNDSEALLHHLIKTDFNTVDIQGYFSCFIMTADETTILVDATAPIYTDGRVYCSHMLHADYTKIELQKIVYCGYSNAELSRNSIEVVKTSYGVDKSYLSLGGGAAWEIAGIDHWSRLDAETKPYESSNIDDFFDLVTDHEVFELQTERNPQRQTKMIKQLGKALDIKFSDAELTFILESLTDLAS